jgi:hypothetical protein
VPAAKRYPKRAPCRQPTVLESTGWASKIVQSRGACKSTSKVCPADSLAVGEMPYSSLAIDQKVEHRVAQMWDVGIWRRRKTPRDPRLPVRAY